MIEDFQNIDLFTPSIFDIAGNMIVALVCGLIIALIYRLTYKGPSYSPTFVNALVLLAMITAVVILVIGNNLARAFGLVGAMSIIRFRTAVRDVQDIVFIFFSLTIGMAAGVGLKVVAVMATLLVCVVILLLNLLNYGQRDRQDYLLQITYRGGEEEEKTLAKLLRQHGRGIRLVNLKSVGTSGEMSGFYRLRLRDTRRSAIFIRDVQNLEFVLNASLLFDTQQNGG